MENTCYKEKKNVGKNEWKKEWTAPQQALGKLRRTELVRL